MATSIPSPTAAPAAPATPEPVEILEEGGIHYFKQGNVRFPVDQKSVVVSVQTLDKLNRTTWMNLAQVNHFPINPFNETLLKPLLIGVIQLEWYKKFSPQAKNSAGVPLVELCNANQAKRLEKYREELAMVGKEKETVKKARKEKAAKEGKVAAPRKAQHYAIAVDAKLDGYKGQLLLILQAMVDLNKPATAVEIAERIKDQLVTKQPPERVVGYYMNVEQKSGLVVAVSEDQVEKETERLKAMNKAFSAGLKAQRQEAKEKNSAVAKVREKAKKGAKDAA
jgi:hypothetical protein